MKLNQQQIKTLPKLSVSKKQIPPYRLKEGPNCSTPLECFEEAYNMLIEAQKDIQKFVQQLEKEIAANLLPLGTVVGWQSTQVTSPSYVLCDGRLLKITDYPDLFNLLGTIYGSQPGMFGVPDFRGRTLVGGGQGNALSPRKLGDSGGEESHPLSVDEMPSHVHYYSADRWFGGGALTATGPVSAEGTYQTSPTGGGAPHNNMPPFSVTLWVIKAK